MSARIGRRDAGQSAHISRDAVGDPGAVGAGGLEGAGPTAHVERVGPHRPEVLGVRDDEVRPGPRPECAQLHRRQVAQVRGRRVGREHEHPAVPGGEVGVGDAAQPAVDVAATADLDGREHPGHGAAGRDRPLERHAAGVVEDDRGAGLGVDRGDEQAALRPGLADQPEADRLEPLLLGGRPGA